MQKHPHLYSPISKYYKSLFGEKTFKIPVSIVDTCPNRMGLKGMETCIFCDEWGSAAFEDSFEKDLKTQIEEYKERLGKRYKANNFVVYFQAYTNSLAGIDKLRSYYELALSYPDINGIVVGTRPDCISPALLKLWKEFSERTYFSVELGIQSYFESQVKWLKRGHPANQSISAIHRIHKECPKIDIGVHFIFGIPGETKEHIVESAKITNSLPIQNVKLHNLHVLKNTGLEDLYHKGEFIPDELEDYAEKCSWFLDYLSKDIFVHRLGALSSRWDELIAPEWTKFKMSSYQKILDHIYELDSFQGKQFQVPPKDYAALSFPTHLNQ
ncbi:MAG: TIGR01212 family radical SAM protein [Bdellovibrionales bacterium]